MAQTGYIRRSGMISFCFTSKCSSCCKKNICTRPGGREDEAVCLAAKHRCVSEYIISQQVQAARYIRRQIAWAHYSDAEECEAQDL